MAYNMKIKDYIYKSFLPITFILTFLYFVPFTNAKELEFTNYDQLLEYTQDVFSTNRDIYYKYKTDEVGQKTVDNYNENILLREEDKEFYLDPVSGKKAVKIYSGQNYVKDGDYWYQVEYASTTEDIFYTELEKTVEPASLFDKMTSLFEFFPVLADSTSTIPVSAYDYRLAEVDADWSTAKAQTTCDYVGNADTYQYGVRCKESSGNYYINRSGFPIDVSSISGENITDARFYIMPYELTASETNEDIDYIVLIQGNPADYTSAQTSDFDNFIFATSSDTIDIDDMIVDTYSYLTLNSTGIDFIDDGGIVTLGLISGGDLENTVPTTGEGIELRNYFTDYTGTDHDPYLWVTYTDEEATSTTATGTIALDEPWYSSDLTIITGKTDHYESTTTEPDWTEYHYYHIPFFAWLIFLASFVIIGSRIILELIIRLRG
jgi:hypothetical protein